MSNDFRTLDLGDEPEDINTPSASEWSFGEGNLVRCTFSTNKIVKMGMGANARKHESRIYWFIEQIDHDLFEARKINKKNVPSGDAETVTMQKLVNDFTPQLSYYEDVILPAMEELEDIIEQGDEYREDGRFYSGDGIRTSPRNRRKKCPCTLRPWTHLCQPQRASTHS